MTNEEAIKWTKWCISKDKECIQKTIERGFPAGEIQETLEYYEFVLRSLQSISVPTDEPLTLDQLREMVDKPAYLYIYDTALDSGWEIIKAVTKDKIIFRGWNTVYVPISSLGKCFDLYAYQPAQIDRETWESCPCCDAAKANSGVVNQALWVKEPEVNKWTLFGKNWNTVRFAAAR